MPMMLLPNDQCHYLKEVRVKLGERNNRFNAKNNSVRDELTLRAFDNWVVPALPILFSEE